MAACSGGRGRGRVQAVGGNWAGNGQEVGSDVSGSEEEFRMEDSGRFETGSDDSVASVISTDGKNRIKRKKGKGHEYGDEGKKAKVELRNVVEYKVFVKLQKEGTNFDDWSPSLLTVALQKEFGEVSARKIRSGLIVMCKTEEQQKQAIKVNKLNGHKVLCSVAYDKKLVRGVISGVPLSESVDAVKKSVKNAKVKEARRLKTKREGALTDSLSILLTFDEPLLPSRVYIGFMSYEVRLYIPPPLRCFKCQRYGHVAAVCKGKQRCSKCSGEHEYGQCTEDAKLKCCNCGGEHSSAYRGCEVSKRMQEVQRVKVTRGVSYAEAARAVKKVDIPVAPVERVKPSERCTKCEAIKEETLIVSKNDFVLFMAYVVNCTAQTEKRTKKIQYIIKGASKFLNIHDMQWEAVRDALNLTDGSTQSQACGGTGS